MTTLYSVTSQLVRRIAARPLLPLVLGLAGLAGCPLQLTPLDSETLDAAEVQISGLGGGDIYVQPDNVRLSGQGRLTLSGPIGRKLMVTADPGRDRFLESLSGCKLLLANRTSCVLEVQGGEKIVARFQKCTRAQDRCVRLD